MAVPDTQQEVLVRALRVGLRTALGVLGDRRRPRRSPKKWRSSRSAGTIRCATRTRSTPGCIAPRCERRCAKRSGAARDETPSVRRLSPKPRLTPTGSRPRSCSPGSPTPARGTDPALRARPRRPRDRHRDRLPPRHRALPPLTRPFDPPRADQPRRRDDLMSDDLAGSAATTTAIASEAAASSASRRPPNDGSLRPRRPVPRRHRSLRARDRSARRRSPSCRPIPTRCFAPSTPPTRTAASRRPARRRRSSRSATRTAAEPRWWSRRPR